MRSANVVVLSKNRAMQLELLLRSMSLYFHSLPSCSVTVVYDESAAWARGGYDLLAQRYSDVRFVPDGDSFQRAVMSSISDDHRFTVFLVDDIFWRASYSLLHSEFDLIDDTHKDNNLDVACVAMRMDPGMDRWYGKLMPVPALDSYRCWRWRDAEKEWSSVMNMDGNVYRTTDIKKLLGKMSFKHPSQMEHVMRKRPLDRQLMVCPPKSVIVNNPLNLVQTWSRDNKKLGVSARSLHERFLRGERICLEKLVSVPVDCPHFMIDPTFEPDPEYGG